MQEDQERIGIVGFVAGRQEGSQGPSAVAAFRRGGHFGGVEALSRTRQNGWYGGMCHEKPDCSVSSDPTVSRSCKAFRANILGLTHAIRSCCRGKFTFAARGCQRGSALATAKNTGFLTSGYGMQRLGELGGEGERKERTREPEERATPRHPSLTLPARIICCNYNIPCFSRYSIRRTVACCGEVLVASIVNSGFSGAS